MKYIWNWKVFVWGNAFENIVCKMRSIFSEPHCVTHASGLLTVVLLYPCAGEVVCEPPNNRLSKYEGILKWNNQTYSLDNDKMLLRGCVLRNTRWCYGLVVFAGKDTKLMMNTGKAIFKRTHIDRLVNTLIIGVSGAHTGGETWGRTGILTHWPLGNLNEILDM